MSFCLHVPTVYENHQLQQLPHDLAVLLESFFLCHCVLLPTVVFLNNSQFAKHELLHLFLCRSLLIVPCQRVAVSRVAQSLASSC